MKLSIVLLTLIFSVLAFGKEVKTDCIAMDERDSSTKKSEVIQMKLDQKNKKVRSY